MLRLCKTILIMWTEKFTFCRKRVLAYHRQASVSGVYPRSLRVALVVGTFLNLINQPEALLGLAPWNLVKLLLTYAVPFLVATYGAVTCVPQAQAAGILRMPIPLTKHNGEAHDDSD